MAEYWTNTALEEFAKMTKEVEVQGKSVVIKKLPGSILEGTGKDTLLETMSKGLEIPKLTVSELRALPVDFVKEVVEQITKFSGINTDQAEKN